MDTEYVQLQALAAEPKGKEMGCAPANLLDKLWTEVQCSLTDTTHIEYS
jgi:hypothetical protein